ncbi:hypothetical protein SV7mr_13840 [Stieleria bergensis]|uniref:Uncharacterized protein n=1 Tax=Stieleria bergensis TaxID=2528025 RepID=A0A517SRX3_9BACT|nr:hypothetical protein SV7mr_13840 [Planctomycetes bacterium SV_7m_r]
MIETRRNQFSLAGMILLTLAVAVWLWIFRETTGRELLTFSAIAFAAGLISHGVYTYWLPWRITGLLSVLLLYNGGIVVMQLIASGGNFKLSDSGELILQILRQPIEMAFWVRTMNDILMLTVILLGTVLFTPAHTIRQELPTALITAMGIGLWYAVGILILTHAA